MAVEAVRGRDQQLEDKLPGVAGGMRYLSAEDSKAHPAPGDKELAVGDRQHLGDKGQLAVEDRRHLAVDRRLAVDRVLKT